MSASTPSSTTCWAPTVVDGKPVYDWTKIDQLYDRLLKMGIKPFVELGFTPWR
jgi:beta-xylosidase